MSFSRWSGRRVETRVLDILEAINVLRSFVAGYERDSYLKDKKTQSAVERQLEIIAEACIQLRHLETTSDLDEERHLERRYPGVEWAQIRGFGNRLRHEYGRIDPKVVWAIAMESRDLDNLGNALKEAFPALVDGR